MTNLILVHETDKQNLTKTIINVENWRAIGRLPGGLFCLITDDCRVFNVQKLTIKKFHAMLQTGLDLTKPGVFDSVSLVCPNCGGNGITDWVSDVTGVKVKRGPLDLSFERDPNLPVLKAKVYTDEGEEAIAYFSRAVIPEAQQHCTTCRGTGLHLMTDGLEPVEFKEHRF